MTKSRPFFSEIVGAILISLVLLMLILSFVVGSVVVFPRSKHPYSPPSQFNLLGTDDLGDDILTLIIKGSRTSLSIGIMGSLISTIIGMIFGAFSGFYGGIVDDIMSGLIDLFIVIPVLPLIIVLATYLTPSLWNIIIVIG